MPLYAVTGASGQLGRLVIESLLDQDVSPADVVAVVRTPSKAAGLRQRGIEIRVADYAQPETLSQAFAGVDRVLLVSSSEAGSRLAHHTNVIEAARRAGASRIAYTSMLNADDTTNPLAGEHRDTEQLLRQAGVPFTLLRNGWYTENYTDQLSRYLTSGHVLGAAGNGRISAATRRDYAIAAAVSIGQDGDGDRTYELGGPAFDLTQLAQIISELTGTQVVYRDLTVDQYADALRRAGLDRPTARFVAALDASIANGDLETHGDDLVQLIGRPATPVTDVVSAARDELSLDAGTAPVSGV
jgi:NAD(P)H dehydrogenase (quinone)